MPTPAEIAALESFSHRWLVQEHLDNDRVLEAILAMHYPPAIFKEWDRAIEAAFYLGLVMNAEP